MSGEKRKVEISEEGSAKPTKLRRLGHSSVLETPHEIVEQIASHLVTENPVETAKNLRGLALSGRFPRNVTMGVPTESEKPVFEDGSPALKRFSGRLKRLGSLAVGTFRDTVPANGLPELGSGGLSRDQRRNEPIAPDDIVKAVGPLLPFQENAARARLVDSVYDLDPEAAASSQKVLARFSHGLDNASRDDLGHDAIAILKAPGNLHEDDRLNAAEAIAHLEKHDHLTSDHRKEIDEAIKTRPRLNTILDDSRQSLAQEDAVDGLVQLSRANGRRPENSSPSIDERISLLEGQRRDASVALVHTDHGRLDVRDEIGREVPKLYDQARAELAASMRDDRGR